MKIIVSFFEKVVIWLKIVRSVHNICMSSHSSILCVSPHTAPTHGFGGPAVVFRLFLNMLNENNIFYTAVSTCNDSTYVVDEGSSKSVYFKSSILQKYAVSLGIMVCLLIYAKKYKYFVINGLSTMPVLLATFLAVLFRKKTMLFTHGGLEGKRVQQWSWPKRVLYRLNLRLLKTLNDRSDLLVIFQSEDEYVKSNFVATKFLICSNYSESFFNNDVEKNYAKLNIVYVGRLSKEKGSDRLLNLLEYFHEHDRFHGHEFSVVIAGPVDPRLSKFDKNENIRIYYNLKWSALSNILSSANVIYFPSRIENFGNSLVEGVAFGLSPCLFTDTHWSVLFEHGAAMTDDDLREILESPVVPRDRLVTMSSRAKQVVIDKFIRGKDMTQILRHFE